MKWNCCILTPGCILQMHGREELQLQSDITALIYAKMLTVSPTFAFSPCENIWINHETLFNILTILGHILFVAKLSLKSLFD